MFVAPLLTVIILLFTIIQPTCLSVDEWIKIWCVCVCMCVCVYIYIYAHTVECYSAMRKKDISLFGTAWMDLEGIMQSEIRQRDTKTV